jgi:hypothetical protein
MPVATCFSAGTDVVAAGAFWRFGDTDFLDKVALRARLLGPYGVSRRGVLERARDDAGAGVGSATLGTLRGLT